MTTGIFNAIIKHRLGAVAQLGERIPRTDEVRGSNPLCSTSFRSKNHVYICDDVSVVLLFGEHMK